MDYTLYLSVLALAVSLFIGIYVLVADSRALINRVFAFFCLSIVLASIGQIIGQITSETDGIAFWSKLSIFGDSFGASICLHYTLILTKRDRLLNNRWSYAILYVPSAISFLYTFGGFEAYQHYNVLALIIKTVISIKDIVFTVLIVFLFIQFRKKCMLHREKRQIDVLLLTSLVCCISYVVLIYYQFTYGFELMPYAIPVYYSLAAISMCYVIIKYKFMMITSVITAEDIVDKVHDLIILLDTDGKIIKVNRGAVKLLGYSENEFVGKQLNNFTNINISPVSYINNSKDPQLSGSLDTQMKASNGESIPVSMFIHIINDKYGDAAGTIVVAQDIRAFRQLEEEMLEREQAEENLRYISQHDQLTGLYNRSFFEENIKNFSSPEFFPVCIMICDVDGLKFINDTLGHNEGDKLLMLAAYTIKKCCPKKSIVSRIGGDEFAVLIPNCPELEGEKILKCIEESVARYTLKNEKLPLNISAGVAAAKAKDTSLRDVFKDADDNMYRQKLSHRQSIRNTIVQTLVRTLENRGVINEELIGRLEGYAKRFAVQLGLSEKETIDLCLLVKYHNIGAIGVPDKVYFKPEPLTPEEREIVKQHSEIGCRIAQSSPELMHLSDCILKHHEWWDGNGYPLGLKGEDIPLLSRILAVIGAYVSMISGSPYREALSSGDAIDELKKYAGIQFDERLVNAFTEMIERERD